MLMQLILLVSHCLHLVGTDWLWPWMSSRVQVEFESSRVESSRVRVRVRVEICAMNTKQGKEWKRKTLVLRLRLFSLSSNLIHLSFVIYSFTSSIHPRCKSSSSSSFSSSSSSSLLFPPSSWCLIFLPHSSSPHHCCHTGFFWFSFCFFLITYFHSLSPIITHYHQILFLFNLVLFASPHKTNPSSTMRCISLCVGGALRFHPYLESLSSSRYNKVLVVTFQLRPPLIEFNTFTIIPLLSTISPSHPHLHPSHAYIISSFLHLYLSFYPHHSITLPIFTCFFLPWLASLISPLSTSPFTNAIH